MIEPLDFITRIREIYPAKYEEFAHGCLKFHLLLKAIYPQCNGFYNSFHIISQIDGNFYDIDGIAEKTSDYLPVEAYGREYFEGAFGGERVGEIVGESYARMD